MKYSHLIKRERDRIFKGKCNKLSIGRIAKETGRNKSTISRELQRNSDSVGYMYPDEASQLAKKRRQGSRSTKINQDPMLKKFIIKNLGKRLSPKMIAALWCRENPSKKISKESIYRFVYSYDGIKMGLFKLLVRAKKKRGFIYRAKRTNIKEAVSIHVRPQEINMRKKLGHYEGDLIFNKGSMSQNVLTLIDRVSRKSIMIFNKSKHSNVVLGNLIKHIKKTRVAIKSITFDNGTEFAEHTKLNDLGIKTYFCDPGKPYQKGSIENFNGMARRYLPFNLEARYITPKIVRDSMTKVNNLPREIFGWLSAYEYAQSIYAKGILS